MTPNGPARRGRKLLTTFSRCFRVPTILFVPRSSAKKGPGLVKAGDACLVSRRFVEVFRSTDYRWRELFEGADVMSEGAVRDEPDGSAYYGTTSLLMPFVSQGGFVPDELARDVARLVQHDPHARVRAIRIACREARVRSVCQIGRIKVELVVRPDPRGIRMDIDVEARVVASSRRVTGVRVRRARSRR